MKYAPIDVFHYDVAVKFQLYNSLFLSLPFKGIEKTGVRLSLLAQACEEGYAQGKSPMEIIDSFAHKHLHDPAPGTLSDFLFQCIQYIERQVVLFDALEDAAYARINDMHGAGTLKRIEDHQNQEKLSEHTMQQLEDFAVRLVLTAHPTQFYPDAVLSILHDLVFVLRENDTIKINRLLQQLGKTPFINSTKPTPYDEAISLIWYLENVFYPTIGHMAQDYGHSLPFLFREDRPILRMGFWPGGDRDGNPNVDIYTTISVAKALHKAIMRCYYKDMRKLKRRLTFKGISTILQEVEERLYSAIYTSDNKPPKKLDIIRPLEQIKTILNDDHNGLFIDYVDDLIHKVKFFGVHFAFIDIRQDADVHTSIMSTLLDKWPRKPIAFDTLSDFEKCTVLCHDTSWCMDVEFEDETSADTFLLPETIAQIQKSYGEEACHRYIISQCGRSSDILHVYTLLYAKKSTPHVSVDIIPLFETIDDLKNAPDIMRHIWAYPPYASHLNQRKNQQTIMLGFSDGTKDGGYVMANWAIYQAKEALTALSKEFNICVKFFDGRGGPPARGGGKTHKFYSSLGQSISATEIQLTIQGQTISSNFGISESARFNVEQLLHAGLSNIIQSSTIKELNLHQKQLIQKLGHYSHMAYKELKNNAHFTTYMSDISPLIYFGRTNIGSRPTKRGTSGTLTIKDLRAIPFVASWNMIKQNVPGFYGIGSALQRIKEEGEFESLQQLYSDSLFFRTLIDNSEMALYKTNMQITAHLKDIKPYSEVYTMIHNEYDLSVSLILQLSKQNTLMAAYPIEKKSIQLREKIVLPLITIQQFALTQINPTLQSEIADQSKDVYEKMVVRSSFGIINAGRNSA